MDNTTEKLFRLSHLALLQVRGQDAGKFLQGQLSCDVLALPPWQLQHGCHCTAKGRMVANFDLLKIADDHFMIRLPASTLPQLLASLSKYIVFSKANVEDLSESFNIYGVLKNADEPPEDTTGTFEDGYAVSLDDERMEYWLPSTAPLPRGAVNDPLLDGEKLWQRAEILSGKGWVTDTTSGEFLPHWLNLHAPAIAGINFTKGCYTGQEIIARMQYKGQLKRHMYRFHAGHGDAPSAGSDLYSDISEKVAATVVNAVAGADGCDCLAIVNGELAEGELLQTEEHRTAENDANKFKREALPYAIP